MQIHIGKVIEKEWRKGRMSGSGFAGAIGHARQNLRAILGRETMDTGLLYRISEVLGRDFFKVYSDRLAGAGVTEGVVEEVEVKGEEMEVMRLRMELAVKVAELEAAQKEIGYLKEIVELLRRQ